MDFLPTSRTQRTRALRYNGKPRTDTVTPAELHRELLLPYCLETSEHHISLRTTARRYVNLLLAACIVAGALLLLFAILKYRLSLAGPDIDIGALDTRLTRYMFISSGVLLTCGTMFLRADKARDSEECLTYLVGKDRFVSCLWPDEFSRAEVATLQLNEFKRFRDGETRSVYELMITFQDNARADLFVAASLNFFELHLVAKSFADSCGLPLCLESPHDAKSQRI